MGEVVFARPPARGLRDALAASAIIRTKPKPEFSNPSWVRDWLICFINFSVDYLLLRAKLIFPFQ